MGSSPVCHQVLSARLSCAAPAQDPNARNCHGYRKFVKRTVLENPNNGYLVNDTIVIRYTIELVVSSGGALSGSRTSAAVPRPPAIRVRACLPQPACPCVILVSRKVCVTSLHCLVWHKPAEGAAGAALHSLSSWAGQNCSRALRRPYVAPAAPLSPSSATRRCQPPTWAAT